jgi:hypothetical protein
MKRPTQQDLSTEGPLPFADEKWAKDFPFVVEMLVAVRYDDGTVRVPSQLTIKEQDGQILASLSDKDLERGLYRVSSTVLGAVRALEKAIAENSADWRPWKPQKGGKGR